MSESAKPKIYSVKSNARRDCRKLGIDPDLVVAVDGGFIISPPVRTTSSDPAASDRSTKGDQLLALLSDWVTVERLTRSLGWKAHTVRGAISTLAFKRSLRIDRRRVDGVTSYRVSA